MLGGQASTNAWSIDQQSGKVNVNFFGDLNLNGNSIINISKILGMDGKWSLDETGKLVVKEVQTDKLCIGKICATEKEFETLFWQAGLLNTQSAEGMDTQTAASTEDSAAILFETVSTTPASINP